MKALLCTQHGDPELLEVRELPSPEPGPGQIRVDVHAAGVNFPDSLIIRNLYQFKPELPFSPGGEIAGVISALGEGVGLLILAWFISRLIICLGAKDAY
ncbi:MAG: hypothetical protein EBW54_06580, partial [Betaproteobacteria bacterium]|nr:hypothetical protein [Betaproteobacteria bacterium]